MECSADDNKSIISVPLFSSVPKLALCDNVCVLPMPLLCLDPKILYCIFNEALKTICVCFWLTLTHLSRSLFFWNTFVSFCFKGKVQWKMKNTITYSPSCSYKPYEGEFCFFMPLWIHKKPIFIKLAHWFHFVNVSIKTVSAKNLSYLCHIATVRSFLMSNVFSSYPAPFS